MSSRNEQNAKGESFPLPERDAISGCVLCGGASRRMGRDKASLELGEDTLLERTAKTLASLCGEVLVASGERLRPTPKGTRCILDEGPGKGPLKGILSALSIARGEWLCVAACDMPGIRGEHFERLLQKALARDLDACWYRSAGRDEPLFAVYRNTCESAMRASLAGGQNKVVAFGSHPGPAGRALRIEALELSGKDSNCSRNLNTPEDVEEERRLSNHPKNQAPR